MPLHYTTFTEFEQEVPLMVQGMASSDLPINGAPPVETVVIQKLTAAESVVDGYLQVRYPIPLRAPDGTVPEIIKQAVHTIAKYYLYSRRNAVTPDILEQYNATMTFLKDVTRGLANIAVMNAQGQTDTSFDIEIITGEEDPQIFKRGWS